VNNKGIIALVIVGLFAVGGAFYLYLSIPKVSRWDENLDTKLKEPYSLDFAERLLLDANKRNSKRINSSDDLGEELGAFSGIEKAIYFYLGDKYNLTSAECKALMDFVQNGNTAFISARYWPNGNSLDSFKDNTFKPLFDLIEPQYGGLSMPGGLNVGLAGFKEKYNFTKYRPNTHRDTSQIWSSFIDLTPAKWDGIDDFEVLGRHELGSNFIRIRTGEGYFYMHCNPLLFSNYFLKEENGYNYYKDVLSFIPEGNTILYDDNSRYAKSEDPNRNRTKDFYPLEIIMQNRALYAFVMTLAGLFLIFIVFNAKRKQRTIPLLPDNSNTSIEFSKTIGSLYLQSGNNKKIVEKKMKMFKFFILNKYGIATANTNEQNLKVIAVKSGLAIGFIKEIFREFEIIMEKSNIGAEELMSFHNRLEIFYNNTKR